MLQLIVSGGQTGVDRAALDAAMDGGIGVAGWCPLGRKAEDGTVPALYPLTETPSANYEQRTEWNVRDSDATLIFYRDTLSGGTLLTEQVARRASKRVLSIDLASAADDPTVVSQWLAKKDISALNVAGPRESGAPGIYEQSREFLAAVFRVEMKAVVARQNRSWLRRDIANCTVGPGCPQEWMKLAVAENRSDVRHCGQCGKDVFLSVTPEAAYWHWKVGRCVALVRNSGQMYLGEAPGGYGYEATSALVWGDQ